VAFICPTGLIDKEVLRGKWLGEVCFLYLVLILHAPRYSYVLLVENLDAP